MARSANQKLKIMYVNKILLDRTDDTKGLKTNEIIDILERNYGITAERKSIATDIHALESFYEENGYISDKEHPFCLKKGYYAIPDAFRSISPLFVRVLSDMLTCSQTIPTLKSKDKSQLLNSLENLLPEEKKKALARYKATIKLERVKQSGDFIKTIEKIYKAIDENKKISFQYCTYTPKGELVVKRNGEKVEVSPWASIWNEGRHYIICYTDKDDILKTYRTDKIVNVTVSDNARTGLEKVKEEIKPDYLETHVQMFSGTPEKVEVIFEDSLSNAIYDRFGNESITPIPYFEKEGYSKVCLTVPLTRQFLAWLLSLKGKIIVSEKTMQKMREILPEQTF
ncbi:MAG: WYL domain-containing protein [Firmicutes bacterium]|nr:WYL domain-containing protein [Bacillota bacterium]